MGASMLRWLVMIVLVATACGGTPDASTTSVTPATTQPAHSAPSRVVVGSGGAEAILPPGADGLDVTVEPIETLEGLFPTGDPAGFVGGVVLEPHGATFEQPVTITIPLTTELEPGRQLRMYHWDGEGTAWEETSFFATVQPDGATAVGDVTHFSYYVLQPSAVGAEQDGIFGDVETTGRTLLAQGVDEAAVTQAIFDQAYAHVNARFPLYSAVPLYVPVVNGYNCYAPVGIFMLLDHGSAGLETPLVETIGNIDDVEFRIDYIREIDVTARHLDPATGLDVETEITGTLVTNVYWRSQPPELEVSTSRSSIWAGESAKVSAAVLCDRQPMKSAEIDFRLVSDPSHVTLSESLGFTGFSGISRSTVSTTEGALGVVTVEVEHFWTDQEGDLVIPIVKSVEIAIGGLTGTWRVSGRETWINCTDPEDNGTWGGTGEATFYQDGETFIGTGTFPRTSDAVVGTVQRIGRDSFEVQGSTAYAEDYGECDADGCYEWMVRGSADFTGIGSIVTQSIDFTWSGADFSGDTCTFTGKGTATRR